MNAFERRRRWRRIQLFKLYAKARHRENNNSFNILRASARILCRADSHSKFAIRLFIVRRTSNKQSAQEVMRGALKD
jgi:hypothetical protein